MKTYPQTYNPLSMSEVVKRRIEKKAEGAEYRAQLNMSPRTVNAGKLQASDSHQKDLEDEFFQMLVKQNALDSDLVDKQSKNSLIQGTKPRFFSLKEGEEKKEKIKANEFSFSIPNSNLGTLMLQGQYEDGVMTVVLNLQKPLELREKVTLEKFLKFRLSEVLQVHVEIKIG